MLYAFRREEARVHAAAETAIGLCRDHGFAYYLAWGTTLQGWALAAQGQGEEGLLQMHHGLATIRATGCCIPLVEVPVRSTSPHLAKSHEVLAMCAGVREWTELVKLTAGSG